MSSMTETFLNLFNAFAYLLLPVLMLIAVVIMARKVPTWIFVCMFVGSLLRLGSALPFAIYSLARVFGSANPPGVAFFKFAGVFGVLGGIVFTAGLFGIAMGMPFPPRRNLGAS